MLFTTVQQPLTAQGLTLFYEIKKNYNKQILMAKKDSKNVFIENRDIPWEFVAQGMRRKIMAYDENVMVVKVEFEKGAIGSLHQHYHTQISHVESGIFEIEIDGEKKVLSGGDAFYVPSNVVHGAVCLESGVLIDVFSPMREDFIQRNKNSP